MCVYAYMCVCFRYKNMYRQPREAGGEADADVTARFCVPYIVLRNAVVCLSRAHTHTHVHKYNVTARFCMPYVVLRNMPEMCV